MTLYPFETEANIIQLVALAVLAIWYWWKNRKSEMLLSQRLFLWGILGFVMVNAYWNLMLFIDGNGTYLFSATDMSVIGTLLIWISLFQLRWPNFFRKLQWSIFTIGAILFGIYNMVWWIVWSGNSVVNTLIGLILTYFLFIVSYGLEKSGALLSIHRISWMVIVIIMILLQPISYFTSGTLRIVNDWICAALWLGLVLLFGIGAAIIKAHRSKFLFASLIYSMYGLYLTDGIRYSAFMIIQTIILVALILSFQKEEFQKDLNI